MINRLVCPLANKETLFAGWDGDADIILAFRKSIQGELSLMQKSISASCLASQKREALLVFFLLVVDVEATLKFY